MRSRRPQKTEADGGHRDEDDRIGRMYEAYAPCVAAYALRRTRPADAADVVAETFLVAWRRRDVIPEEPMTLPWLYGVARRVLANQHRTRTRRSRLHDRLATQFARSESKPSRLEDIEGFQQVVAALKTLSDDDAELLRLTAWEGLTPSQIAAVIGIAPDAVRQRLHRARKRLRKQLLAQGLSSEPSTTATHNFAPRAAGRHPMAALIWELSD